VGLLLMSQIKDVWQLYLFYGFVVGAGMGGGFVAPLSTVARWFARRRGIMTGIVIGGVGIGTLIVPPVATWLISIFAWRNSYLIVGGFILVVGLLAAQLLRRDPAKMGLMPYGEGKVGEQRFAAPEGLVLSEAVRTKRFWMTAIAYFCLGYSLYSINMHLVPNITDLGISPATAASILAVVGALFAAGCIGLGSATDRLGSRQVLVLCFALSAASVLSLVLIREVWMFYLFAVVYGVGSGGGAPVMSTLTAELFGMKSHGAIFGILSLSFAIGGAIGPFLTGYLFDVTGSYQLAFLVCGGSGIVGLVFSSLIRQARRPVLKTEPSF